MKHLSISNINKLHNDKFNKMKRVHFSDGSYCDVYENFKPTSIQKLINNYQDIMNQLQNRNDYSDIGRDITFVFYMLLLKHFTSLEKIIPLDVDKMIVLCEKLIDLGVLEDLLNALPQEELKKIDEAIQKVNENTKIIENRIGETFLNSEINKVETDA
jgi:hypothetical protein